MSRPHIQEGHLKIRGRMVMPNCDHTMSGSCVETRGSSSQTLSYEKPTRFCDTRSIHKHSTPAIRGIRALPRMSATLHCPGPRAVPGSQRVRPCGERAGDLIAVSHGWPLAGTARGSVFHPFVHDSSILCHDGDSLFPFQIETVEHPFRNLLVVSKDATLP